MRVKPRKIREPVEQSKKEKRKDMENNLKNIASAILDCVSETVDKKNFTTEIKVCSKKAQIGSLTINVIISDKIGTNDQHLVFILNQDDKTNLIHSAILNVAREETTVIFASSELAPIDKLEKYIPNIVLSAQNMIKEEK